MRPRFVDLDDALTSGYARVHALEAEWLRIQRSLSDPENGARTQLGERKRELEGQLVDLRVSLARLREAAQSVTAALESAEPAEGVTRQ